MEAAHTLLPVGNETNPMNGQYKLGDLEQYQFPCDTPLPQVSRDSIYQLAQPTHDIDRLTQALESHIP